MPEITQFDQRLRVFGGMMLLMGLGLGTMAWGFDLALCRLPIAYSMGLTVVCGVLFAMTLHFRGPAYLVVIAYVVPLTGIVLTCSGVTGWPLVGLSLAAGICCSLFSWLLLRKRINWD